VQFTYLVPVGADEDTLETEMTDVCARILGCECAEGNRDPCKADWFASSQPIED
jgi:hypothetical protein